MSDAGSSSVPDVTVVVVTFNRRDLLPRARLFVETYEAFEPTPVGCSELDRVSPDTATEVGAVILGRAPGRSSRDEITVYKAMGHVVEDIAAAELVYAAARRSGAGTTITL